MQPLERHVVVVGGGIAGLSAAWFLARNGETNVRVTVLESSNVVGGKLRLDDVGGVVVDVGAESLLLRRHEGVSLVREVGLADDLINVSTTAASIWSRGELRPIPENTMLGVPGDLRALSASGLFTGLELARIPLDLWLPRTRLEGDVSVGRYVGARMGRAVVDRLVEPLLGGVYAGKADLLSLDATLPALAAHARTQRSLTAAAAACRPAKRSIRPIFGSIRGGLGRLPDHVAAAATQLGARVRTRATVRELRRTDEGWVLTIGSRRLPERVTADAVVLAVPAPTAAKLLSHELPAATAELAGIPYASLGIVTLAFPAARLPDRRPGSGFLVPPGARRLIKAATFTTNKWSWYSDATPGLVIVRASVGRFGEEADLQRDDADLIDGVHGDLADMAGIMTTPVDGSVTRWGGALPQYTVGHLPRVERIRATTAAARGLVLCGAAYDGVGISACIKSAERAATELLEQWVHA